MTYEQAYYTLSEHLKILYDKHEAGAITHEVLQHITGLNKLQRLTNKDTLLTLQQEDTFNKMTHHLLKGAPLQYATGFAWFMGNPYIVNEHVLIPRPETEELVQWIIDDWGNTTNPVNILDIGTGSGCIPLSLKLAMKNANITSCDISTEALNVARKNAEILNGEVQFVQADFLKPDEWGKLTTYDVIVSNPPYIPDSERADIHTNVKDFEPSLALFVPDEDPLVFYRAIAVFGKEHLTTRGSIYCELHTDHAFLTKDLFEAMGYRGADTKKDMHGNWRMIKATYNT